MSKTLLLIFVKKPEAGKVKTRLAAIIGNEQALAVYLKLLKHTRDIAAPLDCDKMVCYAPEMQKNDLWNEKTFLKAKQSAGDLGEKMQAAFQQGFDAGYQKICIIGSDCYQLTTAILEEAFTKLQHHEVVIGPSTDGGYYLLGMTQLHKSLFQQKPWSTASVFDSTVADIRKADLSYGILPVLTDVDKEEDLKTME